MAYADLSDVTREGIEEAWAGLARAVRAGEAFEAACKEAGAESFSTAMRSAMLAVSTDLRNGFGPVVASTGPAAYFDEHVDGDGEEAARGLYNDLSSSLGALLRSLRAARDLLQERASDLELLADMADAGLD